MFTFGKDPIIKKQIIQNKLSKQIIQMSTSFQQEQQHISIVYSKKKIIGSNHFHPSICKYIPPTPKLYLPNVLEI